jgi:micrococcal nuclease
MRPRTFLASMTAAAAIGFVAGRWSASTDNNNENAVESAMSASAAISLASVEHVVDGDTIVVSFPHLLNQQDRVRLLGIDTPERGQEWYADSRRALQQMAEGRTVQLKFESLDTRQRDRYGRLLAYVISDGRNLNVEMVRRGWSPYLPKNGGELYKRELIAAEEEARAERYGVWSSR